MRKLIIFVFLLFIVGCSSTPRNTELESSIDTIVEGESETEIRLDAIATFDWEKAYLFSPYSTEKGMRNKMGISFNDPSDIDIRDDIYLLVFVNGNKVVQYLEIERQGSDFSTEDDDYLTPADDKISIIRY